MGTAKFSKSSWKLVVCFVTVILLNLSLLGNRAGQNVAQAAAACTPGPHGGTISSDETWCLSDSPHLIQNDVIVGEGVTLTIQAGVIVKMYGSSRALLIHGTLIAQGTESQPIRFTSNAAAPQKGDWGRIYFGEYSLNNVLDYVTIEYGGYFIPLVEVSTSSLLIDHSIVRLGRQNGIKIVNASPTIQNTEISANNDSAIYLDGGACYPVLSGLSASLNGYDSITINGATYTKDYTWGGNGIPIYRILGDITINQGVTLTVTPGTKVMVGGTASDIKVQGTLFAQGTATDTIRFTSGNDTPVKGDWGNLYFGSNSTGNVLDYVTIEYGGYFIPLVEVSTSSLLIDHSIVRLGRQNGIKIVNASPTIQNNVISNNNDYAIYLDGGSPIIRYNSIMDNDGNGLYNQNNSVTADARCNWWGHATGPYHSSLNPSGQGDEVSGKAIFSPWLTSPDGDCTITNYQVFLPITVR